MLSVAVAITVAVSVRSSLAAKKKKIGWDRVKKALDGLLLDCVIVHPWPREIFVNKLGLYNLCYPC